MPPSEVFRYLQIKHFIQSTAQSQGIEETLTLFQRLSRDVTHAEGRTSLLYTGLIQGSNMVNHSYVCSWAQDRSRDVEIEDWKQISEQVKSPKQNAAALETDYKELLTWHYVTPHPPVWQKWTKNKKTPSPRDVNDVKGWACTSICGGHARQFELSGGRLIIY